MELLFLNEETCEICRKNNNEYVLKLTQGTKLCLDAMKVLAIPFFLSSFVVFPTFFLMSLPYWFEEDAIFLIECGPCFENSCSFF